MGFWRWPRSNQLLGQPQMFKYYSGNSAVGLAYKSGGLGVPGSNPGCPKSNFE